MKKGGRAVRAGTETSPTVATADNRFLLLLISAGTSVRWNVHHRATRSPDRTVSTRQDTSNSLPIRVKRGTADGLLDAVCACYVALRGEEHAPIGMVVFLPEPRSAEAHTSGALRGPHPSLAARTSARALLRRVIDWHHPRLDRTHRTWRRDATFVLKVGAGSRDPLPPAREIFAAREFLRAFIARNGIALWASAPVWLMK